MHEAYPPSNVSIHNTYYIAGSWKQVAMLLDELKSLAPDVRPEDLGGEFRRKDGTFRDRYVLLYRQIVALTGILQKNVALAAAASSECQLCPNLLSLLTNASRGKSTTVITSLRFSQLGWPSRGKKLWAP